MTYTFQNHRQNEFVPLMIELVKLYEPHTYMEIGTQKGFTFNRIAQIPQVKRAVGVDIKLQKSVWRAKHVQLWEMTSKEFAKIWTDPIDLLFIDGDHSRDAVLQDFELFSPYVPNGHGLILLHDTHPNAEHLLSPRRCNDAWQAARYIHKKCREIEIVTLPGPHAGLSILRKVPVHLAWLGL
jgi:cephalosporin hydroxylase